NVRIPNAVMYKGWPSPSEAKSLGGWRVVAGVDSRPVRPDIMTAARSQADPPGQHHAVNIYINPPPTDELTFDIKAGRWNCRRLALGNGDDLSECRAGRCAVLNDVVEI